MTTRTRVAVCGIVLLTAFALVQCAVAPKEKKAADSLPRHGVFQETWCAIPGSSLADAYSSPSLSGMPDRVVIIRSFATELAASDSYSRFRAILMPHASGPHAFWIAADDCGELMLSTDEKPANITLIARVPSCTGRNEWSLYPSQRSRPFTLDAGKKYYIEARLKHGRGDNFLQIAWQGPGFSRQVISGAYLAPVVMDPSRMDTYRRTREYVGQIRADGGVIEQACMSGRTLPTEFSRKYPPPSQGGTNDTGINILLDHARHSSLHFLGTVSACLRKEGYRVCGTEAALDSMLTPGNPVRIRIPFEGTHPFAWWPAPAFNVVIVGPSDPQAHDYLPEERISLQNHVESGGGLVIFGGTPLPHAPGSINSLAALFGARYRPTPAAWHGSQVPALDLDKEWEVIASGEQGEPIQARRVAGKGRVVLMPTTAGVCPDPSDNEQVQREKRAALHQLIRWASSGRKPVGGSASMPVEHGGCGGVYPELEQNIGGVVILYARNQKPAVRTVIEQYLPVAKAHLDKWLPTTKADSPTFIIAASGTGSGWTYHGVPKEIGIFAPNPTGIVGAVCHELARTMRGPVNDAGFPAGRSPHGVQGAAHSGWFQGKVEALYSGATTTPNRACNTVLDQERAKGRPFDITVQDNCGKEWWIWQKLDDRYGTTWFPRWYWVRATRWKDDPDHVESWDEMVEDMSIAVGEDLVPWFKQIGTTLSKDQIESIEFQGVSLDLPVAPLNIGPAGPVRIEFPGDYKKPLPPPPPPPAPTR